MRKEKKRTWTTHEVCEAFGTKNIIDPNNRDKLPFSVDASVATAMNFDWLAFFVFVGVTDFHQLRSLNVSQEETRLSLTLIP